MINLEPFFSNILIEGFLVPNRVYFRCYDQKIYQETQINEAR